MPDAAPVMTATRPSRPNILHPPWSRCRPRLRQIGAAVVEQRIAPRVGAVAEPVDQPEVDVGERELVGPAEQHDGLPERVDDPARTVEAERPDDAALVHADEVGDVLYYAARLALEMGYSFNLVAESNLEKLQYRKQRDVLTGSGDDR